jgi:histidinol-phosphate/aromatic aminotransferase/cobyric acid decarboxylase-like protein
MAAAERLEKVEGKREESRLRRSFSQSNLPPFYPSSIPFLFARHPASHVHRPSHKQSRRLQTSLVVFDTQPHLPVKLA